MDAAAISRNIDVDIPIVADAKKAICALLEKAKPLRISEWTDEINRWKKEYPIDMGKVSLTPQMVIQSINETFKDAVITTDVGQNQLRTALVSAKQNTNAPTVIEFMIDREVNVMPIVPPGNSLHDMILEGEENRE